MDVLTILLLLAILIFVINVIPVFMPPTWIILAFFYINFHPPFLLTILIGAAATIGRIALYFISKNYFRGFFSKYTLKNYGALGQFIGKNEKLSIPIFVIYAFFPISSNYVYIAAGLAEINIKILASSFFVGRLISYSFWVAASHAVNNRLEDIFANHIGNASVIFFEITGLIIIYLIGKINWAKILKLE